MSWLLIGLTCVHSYVFEIVSFDYMPCHLTFGWWSQYPAKGLQRKGFVLFYRSKSNLQNRIIWTRFDFEIINSECSRLSSRCPGSWWSLPTLAGWTWCPGPSSGSSAPRTITSLKVTSLWLGIIMISSLHETLMSQMITRVAGALNIIQFFQPL